MTQERSRDEHRVYFDNLVFDLIPFSISTVLLLRNCVFLSSRDSRNLNDGLSHDVFLLQ